MSSSTLSLYANQSLALDPQGVESLRRINSHDSQAGDKAVAKQFETLLMQQMLGAMRKANQEFGEESSGEFGLFRSMQDQQLAQLGLFKGGVGLTDAIVRQISQQRGTLSSQSSSTNTVKATASTGSNAAVTAKTAGSGSNIAGNFIEKLSSAAQGAAASLGVAPELVLAHAALESGWGRKSIKNTDGSDSFNLFGIKAGKSWTGKTVDVMTTEYVDGKYQKRVEKFRAYDSLGDAFNDYAAVLKRRFGDALGQGANGAAFGQALQSSGYATDPHYASKIAGVAKSIANRLSTYQRGSSQLG